MIESLIAVQSTSSLLVIGTYRDNEVGSGHPLLASQDRMSGEKERVRMITLLDLTPADVDHLLADTLQTTAAECRNLSQVLLEKTAGNPFFFRQQLYALESEELLSFDRDRLRWTWAEDLHQSLQTGGNVVDLMISKIRTLPIESQKTLSMAACIGNRFDTATLSTITLQDSANILTALSPALQEGLINRSNGYFSFVHDRIQEAGYGMIPKEDRPHTHLEIGRLLRANVAGDEMEEDIFTIVTHLNAGRTLTDSRAEKLDLAALNLAAGQKAKAAAVFADAKQYVEIGLELLEPDSWQKHYDLTLSLHNENGELASLTGQFDQIAPIVDLIRENAKNIYDQMDIYMTQIEADTSQYNFAKALEFGLDVLKDLGVEIPRQPTPEDFQKLKEKLMNLLTSRPAEKVAELPEMSDETALAATSLLASEMSAAFVINPSLYPIIPYLGSIFTLEFGLNAWTPTFFGNIPVLTFSSIGPETSADEASDLIRFCRPVYEITQEMLNNPVTARGRTKGLNTVTAVSPWMDPIAKANELAQVLFRSGFESGDLLYGSYGAFYFAMSGFAAGMNLDVYQDQLSDHVNSLLGVGQKTTLQWLSIYLQAAQNFKETSPEPHKLNGPYFSEDEWLPSALAAKDGAGLHVFTINKLVLTYHFDIDDKLDKHANETGESLASMFSLFSIPVGHFYFSLAKLRLLGSNSTMDHPRTITVVDSSLRLMENWSLSVPSTFRHKYDLIAAEKAKFTGDLEGAFAHYEQAISGARENGFTHEEALANELYARFWLERDNERFASQFMREAHSLYRKWGALAKAEHLTERYPDLLVGKRITIDQSHTTTSTGQISGDLDILTVLKASRAIAGEIELERLLNLLMTIAIENSGAQSGCLLLPEAGGWMIAAQADLDDSKPQVEQPISITESGLLSQGVVNYVANTQQTVLLDDALEHGDYIDDTHIQRHEVKSLLCTPLVNQGKTSAILYLENNIAPDVFTPERLELLQLLSSQMAISIDNARTHEQLEQLLEERSKALSSAEAQIRSMFENSPVGIALSTYGGHFLTVNKSLLKMLRISEEKLLLQGVVDFYADPADRSTLLTELQESGSVQDFGIRLVRSDGEFFYGSVNMSRLILEGNEVLLVMAEDVTDEITAEHDSAIRTERERLARELHDSVTQTLFSASVLAQSAPRLMEKNPPAARQNMEQQSLLIRGALAEMRALLFELRSSEFTDQNLSQLFDLLAESTQARTRANVVLNVETGYLPPEDVAIAYYRIARESLNNVAKHALAGEVVIDLTCDPEGAKLLIKDDGRGFDPHTIPAGHMGVSIMQERAQDIGAKIVIESESGRGTKVSVFWSAGENESKYE